MKKLRRPSTFIALSVLVLILLLAFGVRLYRIDRPIADWHSWRQADTASVTREFVKHGVDLLRPQFHDLSSIPNGMDNPRGWRMVEFPIINALTAIVYRVTSPFTHIDLTLFMRLASVKFSLGSILLLFLLTNMLVAKSKLEGIFTTVPLVAAAILAFMPFNVFYSQAILPEVPLVFFTVLASLLFLKYVYSKNMSWLVVGIGAASIALLLKPIALFFWLPIILLSLKHRGIRWIMQPKHLIAATVMFVPFGLWRSWIQQFPQGIPANRWLFNGNGIRFRPAWFRWLFADRMGRLLLGYWGLLPFGFGLLGVQGNEENSARFGFIEKIQGFIRRFKPRDLFSGLSKYSDLDLFMYGSLVGVLAYLVVFATGNVQHDYYQVIIVPYVALTVAAGLVKLVAMRSVQSVSLAFVSVVFMLAFSWYEVKGLFNINNPAIVEAGKAVDALTEKDALIIAPYAGDTAFLYQTNRRGWPIGGAIEQKIAAGADYYVTTSLDEEAQELINKYPVVKQTDGFSMIQLRN